MSHATKNVILLWSIINYYTQIYKSDANKRALDSFNRSKAARD